MSKDINVPFPLGGIHEGQAFSGQPPSTTSDARNVTGMDPVSGRSRGGQRAGLSKFNSKKIGVKKLSMISTVSYDSTPSSISANASGSEVTEWSKSLPENGNVCCMVVDSANNVYTVDSGATIIKYNPTGYQLYAHKVPLKDPGHRVSSIAIDDDAGIIYVGTSVGSSPIESSGIFAFEEVDNGEEVYLSKIWDLTVGAYVDKLAYKSGKLYAAVNGISSNQAIPSSQLWVMSSVASAVPQVDKKIECTYPISDFSVSPKDGSIFTTSPKNTQRPADRDPINQTVSPSSVDWDPTKLESFEKRAWAWFDASDIDGDGSNNALYSDGEEIRLWVDKSGNGRDLQQPNVSLKGPFLSKAQVAGRDCLSFANVTQAGTPDKDQYLVSGTSAARLGDSIDNSQNLQNKSLIPTYDNASFALFMVIESADDAVPRPVIGQRYSYFGVSDDDAKGAMCILANSTSTYGSVIGPNVTASASSGYASRNISLKMAGSLLTTSRTSNISAATDSVNLMPGFTGGYSTDGTTDVNTPQVHSGSSNSNRYVLSLIVRVNNVAEPLLPGKLAVANPGYATTSSCQFRVNGETKGSFKVGRMNSLELTALGYISNGAISTLNTNSWGFRGRICEVIVLKDWYYRPDETSTPIRLNVCGSRPTQHTVADHGEYTGLSYDSVSGSYTNDTNQTGQDRIHETEMIEGYLAHKWGMSNLLPNRLSAALRLGGAVIPSSGATLLLPSESGNKLYTFTTSQGSSSSNLIYIHPGAANSEARIKLQAEEICKVINGEPGQLAANAPAHPSIYALPPTFSLDELAANREAIIHLRSRASTATTSSGPFDSTQPITITGVPALTVINNHAPEFANSTTFSNTLKPRSKLSTTADNYGYNYSTHPFAEHRRQVHQSKLTPANWTAVLWQTPRTLGGPPRSDMSRKFQPLQVMSSTSQNLCKYDKDGGELKWTIFNLSPEGVASGNNYTGYGGIGFGVAVNQDGLVYSSGQRTSDSQFSFPTISEQFRLGLSYPTNLNDVRATNDLKESQSLSWQSQVVANSALYANLDGAFINNSTLTSSFGWSRPSVDYKGNFVLPVHEQHSISPCLIIYKNDGTELNRHNGNAAGDSSPMGLSCAASKETIVLPPSFVNPRSEFVYLGTISQNEATLSFTANPANTSTITFSDSVAGSQTYTFTTSAPSGIDRVLIGGTLSDTILNLVGAINISSGSYSSTTQSLVVAARSFNSTSINLTGRRPVPPGSNGTFSVSFNGAVNASVSAVTIKPATIRRINLYSVNPSGVVGSYRATRNIAIDGEGSLYYFDNANLLGSIPGSAFSATSAQYYDSAVLFQKLYVTNGFQVLVYDPALNQMSKIESKSSGSPTERWSLISSWRGRLVLARGLTQPHNWIMSAIGDPTDWDLFPPVVNPGQAVAGTISRAGLVPDIINSVIPYNDDLLLFGGDRSIFRLTGDPMSNGQMDLVTDVVGIAFGRAWDKDPQGNLYFLSSRGALYVMPPGRQIRELSLGKFEQRLSSINFSKSYTQLIWNDVDRTLHIFTFPFGQQVGSPSLGYPLRHFRYERDSSAFWEDSYVGVPTCAAISDSDSPSDRALLIGFVDNYVRKWDNSASDDDGSPIDSYVTFGPFGSQDSQLRMSMIKAILADNQGGVNIQLFSSDNPDVMGDPVWAGKLVSGSNPNLFTRVKGSYFWIRLRNNQAGERWSFENMKVRVDQAGRKRV